MFILMATFQPEEAGWVGVGWGESAQGGEREGKNASSFLAINCVFLIKSPQIGEPILGKEGGKS